MASGSLIIQQRFGFTDEETVEQIIENPYLQYFIGLPENQRHKPFDSSMMVYFRKRITSFEDIPEDSQGESWSRCRIRGEGIDKHSCGYAFTDRISWENYDEGTISQEQIENYKRRFGYYPKEGIVDKIYRNRSNYSYCKPRGIRLRGPPLGRPRMDENERLKVKKREREDISIRNQVEGSFGNGKRKYGLGLIMTELSETSEKVITLNFMIMNLQKRLRLLLCRIFYLLKMKNFGYSY